MGRHQADTKKAYRKRRRQRKKVEENIQKTANPTVTSTCKSDDELDKNPTRSNNSEKKKSHQSDSKIMCHEQDLMPFERDPLYLKWMEFKRLNNKIHKVVTGKFY